MREGSHLNPKVKHWVRNLERRGFWLPLPTAKFYPDFVAQLTDGRIFVVEHKGKVYATNDDSKEKCNVGDLWENTSGGKALFLMTVVAKGSPSLSDQNRRENWLGVRAFPRRSPLEPTPRKYTVG